MNHFSIRPLRTLLSLTAAIALAVAGTITLGAGSTAALTSAPIGSVTVQDSRTDMLGHGADIFWVRLVNRDQVKVVIQHRDLVRSWRPQSSGTVYLDTDPATTGPDVALVAGLYSGGDYTMYRTDGWRIRYGRPLPGYYSMQLRYGIDRTVLEVPRRTLGRPGRVRASVHTAGSDQAGHEIHDFLRRPNSFTPWVRRG